MTWMSGWCGRADKPASCCRAGATEGDGSCGCACEDARRPCESVPSNIRRLSVAPSLCTHRDERERTDEHLPSSGQKSVMLPVTCQQLPFQHHAIISLFYYAISVFLNLLACARKPCVRSHFVDLVTGNGVTFTRIQVERLKVRKTPTCAFIHIQPSSVVLLDTPH